MYVFVQLGYIASWNNFHKKKNIKSEKISLLAEILQGKKKKNHRVKYFSKEL